MRCYPLDGFFDLTLPARTNLDPSLKNKKPEVTSIRVVHMRARARGRLRSEEDTREKLPWRSLSSSESLRFTRGGGFFTTTSPSAGGASAITAYFPATAENPQSDTFPLPLANAEFPPTMAFTMSMNTF